MTNLHAACFSTTMPPHPGGTDAQRNQREDLPLLPYCSLTAPRSREKRQRSSCVSRPAGAALAGSTRTCPKQRCPKRCLRHRAPAAAPARCPGASTVLQAPRQGVPGWLCSPTGSKQLWRDPSKAVPREHQGSSPKPCFKSTNQSHVEPQETPH